MYEPQEAVERAARFAETVDSGTVFISDSGDNITAGSAGDSAYMLKLLLDADVKHALLAGITDAGAVHLAFEKSPGDEIDFVIGGSIDARSVCAQINGLLLSRGEKHFDGVGCVKFAVVRARGVTVMITDQRFALIESAYFADMGINLADYKIAVIKLGYLYADIERVACKSILALSPGNSYLDVARIDYSAADARFYPRDTIDYSPVLVL